MYFRATSKGVVISTIVAEAVRKGDSCHAEFSFDVSSPQGAEYVFRYQTDDRGRFGWHLYKKGHGRENLSIDRKARNSLGFLPADCSDSDIEALIESMEQTPPVSILVIAPIHPDSGTNADFVIFPMGILDMARMKALDSVSDQIVGMDNAAQKVSGILWKAKSIILTDEQKREFMKNPDSELGIIRTSLRKHGFYIYIAGKGMLPPFLNRAMEAESYDALYFERNSDESLDGAIVSSVTGQPVGIISNIQSIVSKYNDIIQQAIRMENMQKSARKAKAQRTQPKN